jgi:predicted transcriptional regulator
MTKKLVEIAAEIVQNQVSTNPMSSEEIVSSLKNVFSALQTIQKSEAEGAPFETGKGAEEGPGAEKLGEKADPKSSILEDRIVCLECGAEMRQLTAKHLGAHGLSPRDYKQKYGFPMKQPLSAKALTKARSKAAKKRGLPENLVKYQEGRKQKKIEEMAAGMDAPPTTSGSATESKPASKRSRKKKAE